MKVEEILFEVAHEQVSIGGGHTGAHDLEKMTGVEGEIVVGNSFTISLTPLVPMLIASS